MQDQTYSYYKKVIIDIELIFNNRGVYVSLNLIINVINLYH